MVLRQSGNPAYYLTVWLPDFFAAAAGAVGVQELVGALEAGNLRTSKFVFTSDTKHLEEVKIAR